MIRLVVFLILLQVIFCKNDPFYVESVSVEPNKSVTLPPNAGNDVVFRTIKGTLSSASLAQLSVTRLELRVSNADQLEPGAVCSPPPLKSLHLSLGRPTITVTKDMLKNCEKLETLHVGGFYYRRPHIAMDALSHLHHLRDLTLSELNLPVVTKEYFRNLSSLESLTLEECLIEEVDSDAFNTTNLKNLKIKTAIDLRGSYNIFSEIPLKVQNFTFDSRVDSLTTSKLDVTELYFRIYPLLEAIEPGAACPTSSVRKLTLYFGASKSINFTKETLQNCENLEDLRLRADNFHPSQIETDTFQNLAKLKNFSSENVKMRHVTKDTFKNSLLLENLRLCNGDIIEIDSDAFNHLQHLKTVEICLHSDENNLENTKKLFTNTLKADKLTFKELSGKLSPPQFKDVKELSLDFVNLKETESGVCSLPTLKNFTLKFIPGDNFTLGKDAFNCENLEEFSLTAAGVHPSDVPDEAFQHLSHLKILSLTWINFNPLRREYFKNLQSLEKLVLNKCFVDEIQSYAFDDLINLKVLKIGIYHGLKQLPVKLFTKNVKLETLELPNLIEELNWEMFKGLPHLTSLVVSSERISSFNAEKVALNIPNLRRFENKKDFDFFADDAYTRFKGELKKLNVTIISRFQ